MSGPLLEQDWQATFQSVFDQPLQAFNQKLAVYINEGFKGILRFKPNGFCHGLLPVGGERNRWALFQSRSNLGKFILQALAISNRPFAIAIGMQNEGRKARACLPDL